MLGLDLGEMLEEMEACLDQSTDSQQLITYN